MSLGIAAMPTGVHVQQHMQKPALQFAGLHHAAQKPAQHAGTAQAAKPATPPHGKLNKLV